MMKKISMLLAIIVLFVVAFSLSGCSNKSVKIKCEGNLHVGSVIELTVDLDKDDGTTSGSFTVYEATADYRVNSSTATGFTFTALTAGIIKIEYSGTLSENKGSYYTPKYEVTKRYHGSKTIEIKWNNEISVSVASDLRRINKYDKVTLQNDIDLSGVEFEPIAEFGGVFDGNGYSIKNLKLDQYKHAYLSFIAKNSGTIKNISFVDLDVLSLGDATNLGIVAENNGTIVNVAVSGDMFGDLYTNVGGICATNNGVIKNCKNYAFISGFESVGGIVGSNTGTVINCINYGDVTAKRIVGGVVGYNSSTVALNGNMNSGNITAVGGVTLSGVSFEASNVGGIAGKSVYKDSGNKTTISNCYNAGSVSGVSKVDGIVGEGELIINCYSSTISNIGSDFFTSGTDCEYTLHKGVVYKIEIAGGGGGQGKQNDVVTQSYGGIVTLWVMGNGQKICFTVGKKGGAYNGVFGGVGGTGYTDGGNGGDVGYSYGAGGGGGGSSAITLVDGADRVTPANVTSIAGGGGGGQGVNNGHGGNGGSPDGADGTGNRPGRGATLSAVGLGGSKAGENAQAGEDGWISGRGGKGGSAGSNSSSGRGGGGGGGGYFGGGGGGGHDGSLSSSGGYAGGGGGGSSWVDTRDVSDAAWLDCMISYSFSLDTANQDGWIRFSWDISDQGIV